MKASTSWSHSLGGAKRTSHRHFPNFQFEFVPVYNSAYLPDPSLPEASELRFPYDDNSFDFVFARSVFTHLTPQSSTNYLRESQRVLRPDGLFYSTWFLFEGDPATSVSPLIAGMQLDASGELHSTIRVFPTLLWATGKPT